MALLIKEALCIKPLTGHQCEGRCQCNYTFKAYYLSLTLQPLLPSPTTNYSPRSHTMTHQNLILVFSFVFISLVFSFSPLFFSFGRDKSHLQVGILLVQMVRFFCCLHQPLRGEIKRWLTIEELM